MENLLFHWHVTLYTQQQNQLQQLRKQQKTFLRRNLMTCDYKFQYLYCLVYKNLSLGREGHEKSVIAKSAAPKVLSLTSHINLRKENITEKQNNQCLEKSEARSFDLIGNVEEVEWLHVMFAGLDSCYPSAYKQILDTMHRISNLELMQFCRTLKTQNANESNMLKKIKPPPIISYLVQQT